MNNIVKEENEIDDILSYDYYYNFPRKYQRSWLGSIDKRFALILLGSFIVHVFTASYFAMHPPRRVVSDKDIENIQEQYVNLIIEKEIEVKELEDEALVALTVGRDKSAAAEEGSKGDAGDPVESEEGNPDTNSGERSGAGTTVQRTTSGVSARSGSRGGSSSQVSQDVGSRGLLGLLTSSAETSRGSEAADILSEVDAGGGDLDKALSSVDRLKVGSQGSSRGTGGGTGTESGSGTGGRGVKGSRASSSEGIGGVISGRGTAKSKKIDRQGGLVVSAVSEVANDKGFKTQSRNPDEVSAVINDHNSSIQYCYQRELKRNPDLRGKIVVRFTIAPNGRVSDAKILSSSINNQSVERCVLNRIRRWDDFGVIDASSGDAVFRQVYTFGY